MHPKRHKAKRHSFAIIVSYDGDMPAEDVRHNLYNWLAVYACSAPDFGFYFSAPMRRSRSKTIQIIHERNQP